MLRFDHSFLGLVVTSENGSRWLPKRYVLTMEKSLREFTEYYTPTNAQIVNMSLYISVMWQHMLPHH